ncbi:HNH endonuclease [Streptomyces sp. NBC_01262]|uniref:HNH endonuclease n=1 Tax=Streptomyces sp. NBC_01262 TaxID=2903803 RepID=UPI002E3012CF|nr:HNH endonuclease [Streptomyces sp. NBC_01262]
MTRSKGRSGRPWRRARARTLAESQVCAWCGHNIDMSIEWPDPMSASVDHDTPLSKGGDPLARHNLKPFHLVCNQIKGNRTAPPPAPTSRDW